MQFLSKIHILLVFCFFFSGIQIIHASENGDGEQIILPQEGPKLFKEVRIFTLEDFTQRIKEELGDDEDLKRNLDSLIQNITPAINELEYEGIPLKTVLLNNKYQLGAYFEEVVKNAIKYKYERGDIAPYKDILQFINPVGDQFNDKLVFFYDISDPKTSHSIFKDFFKIFFFRSQYPDSKTSVPYHVLKYFLAHLAIFAFDNKETVLDMTDSIRILHSNKGQYQKKTNNIFTVFIDGAVRLYAYRIKERTDLLNKASRTQRAWMRTKAFFKTPVSDNAIIFLAQQWNKINHMACDLYLRFTLRQSLKAYDLEDKQAKKTSEDIKIKAIGNWWQRHQYKILAASGVGLLAAGGIAALKLDETALEEIKRAAIGKLKQIGGWLQNLRKSMPQVLTPATPPPWP